MTVTATWKKSKLAPSGVIAILVPFLHNLLPSDLVPPRPTPQLLHLTLQVHEGWLRVSNGGNRQACMLKVILVIKKVYFVIYFVLTAIFYCG